MSQIESNLSTALWVNRLIRACRDTQFAFEASAGAIEDRLLRAELLQYSGQRREFIAELIAVARRFGTDVVDPGNIREPLARHTESVKISMDAHHDVGALLEQCERAEIAAMATYRAVAVPELPAAARAMVITHLTAITRVRDRLNRLRINAQPDRN